MNCWDICTLRKHVLSQYISENMQLKCIQPNSISRSSGWYNDKFGTDPSRKFHSFFESSLQHLGVWMLYLGKIYSFLLIGSGVARVGQLTSLRRSKKFYKSSFSVNVLLGQFDNRQCVPKNNFSLISRNVMMQIVHETLCPRYQHTQN